ncbi:hypothetical protein CLOSTASPAR_00753 [[Clostridium] asparagiforme DSM 15981]|uniref:Uncharacterized protein n=1 Tax=[Clostridium] asparagiforme DSM 15981 TaxID=518636 RepID=C0CUR1_9FIRM|nr:hypothetical protein CLOSTASPAR_00753 [[Clostridium] asparagiforme DSM 15981]
MPEYIAFETRLWYNEAEVRFARLAAQVQNRPGAAAHHEIDRRTCAWRTGHGSA